MELILVRHARPERVVNTDTPADPALTELGHRQARALAGWMAGEPCDALYSSPMQRARQTAAPLGVLLGVDPVVEEGVREYDELAPAYIPMEELKADREAYQAWLVEHHATDWEDFRYEVVETLERICAEHRGQRVVVVCHGGVINIWASHVLGLGDRMFFEPYYTSVNRFLAASSGERSILSLNESAHLRGWPDLRIT
jgi:probable phosphoglycerate mutase